MFAAGGLKFAEIEVYSLGTPNAAVTLGLTAKIFSQKLILKYVKRYFIISFMDITGIF